MCQWTSYQWVRPTQWSWQREQPPSQWKEWLWKEFWISDELWPENETADHPWPWHTQFEEVASSYLKDFRVLKKYMKCKNRQIYLESNRIKAIDKYLAVKPKTDPTMMIQEAQDWLCSCRAVTRGVSLSCCSRTKQGQNIKHTLRPNLT